MYGKLGHGTEAGCSRPKVVGAVEGLRVKEVACGSRHTLAVVEGGGEKYGNLLLCGSPSLKTKATTLHKLHPPLLTPQINPPLRLASLVAFAEVYGWGDKENGVSGHGETEGHQYTPRALQALRGVNVIGVSACGFHSAVVDSEGAVFSWGEGKFGRLGHGNERNALTPKRVEALADEKVRNGASLRYFFRFSNVVVNNPSLAAGEGGMRRLPHRLRYRGRRRVHLGRRRARAAGARGQGQQDDAYAHHQPGAARDPDNMRLVTLRGAD